VLNARSFKKTSLKSVGHETVPCGVPAPTIVGLRCIRYRGVNLGGRGDTSPRIWSGGTPMYNVPPDF